MRIALYARVSTRDKDQNPETQLLPLREYAASRPDDTVSEYVDQASATDLKHRAAWQQLVDDARHRKVDLVIVWRMDRAFRSVLHAAQTLESLKAWGVGLKSYQEAWLDTTTPMGEMLYYITIAYAQLEKTLISERVKAGMDRAQRQGKRIGRRPIRQDPTKWRTACQAVEAVETGRLSYRQAAKQYGVSLSTIQRTRARLRHVDRTQNPS